MQPDQLAPSDWLNCLDWLFNKLFHIFIVVCFIKFIYSSASAPAVNYDNPMSECEKQLLKYKILNNTDKNNN